MPESLTYAIVPREAKSTEDGLNTGDKVIHPERCGEVLEDLGVPGDEVTARVAVGVTGGVPFG